MTVVLRLPERLSPAVPVVRPLRSADIVILPCVRREALAIEPLPPAQRQA